MSPVNRQPWYNLQWLYLENWILDNTWGCTTFLVWFYVLNSISAFVVYLMLKAHQRTAVVLFKPISRGIKKVHTFSTGISLIVNIIMLLEFKLYYDGTVEPVCHYATWPPSLHIHFFGLMLVFIIKEIVNGCSPITIARSGLDMRSCLIQNS